MQLPRSLPGREVTDESLDDAYVAFIFYCNPAVAPNTPSDELRRIFRSPPRSDGKTFNTFTLFELIRDLEFKTLKSWAQLATELGVEPPQLEKGQSSQKIQQYAVRLKRWMHAMHVDAFFEFLLGKNHVYWTRVPEASGPSEDRDGVSPEEDLALRALLPETRPKRGRKKAEDKDEEGDKTPVPARRRRVHSPSQAEGSVLARTPLFDNAAQHVGAQSVPHPLDGSTFNHNCSPAAQGIGPAHPPSNNSCELGSQLHNDSQPAYSQSADAEKGPNSFQSYDHGRSSAVPPPQLRSSSQHDYAPSSAWPSTNSSSSSRLSVRPPDDPNVPLGSDSYLRTNLNHSDTLSYGSPRLGATPGNQSISEVHFSQAKPLDPRPGRNQPFSQVPDGLGEVVGMSNTQPGSNMLNFDPTTGTWAVYSAGFDAPPSVNHAGLSRSGDFSTHELKNPPNTAPRPSTTVEAARQPDRTNVQEVEFACCDVLLSAYWYNVAGEPTTRCSVKEALLISKQIIIDICEEAPTKELFLLTLGFLLGASGMLSSGVKCRRLDRDERTLRFGIKWSMRFGELESNYYKTFEIKEAAISGIEKQMAEGLGIPSGVPDHAQDNDPKEKRFVEMIQMMAREKEKRRKLVDDLLRVLMETAFKDPGPW